MILISILDLLVLLQLGSSIYSFVSVKDSTYDNDNSEKAKKLSLTTIIILTILIILINYLYLSNTINEKRTILNIILLAIVSSGFIFTNFIYLNYQKTKHPGYDAAETNLKNNSDNTNKDVKDFNLIVGSITVAITFLSLSFFIGYKFYSRTIIKEITKPIIVEETRKPRKSKFVKLNLKGWMD